jgi:2-dehydropantoate 2-reductase
MMLFISSCTFSISVFFITIIILLTKITSVSSESSSSSISLRPSIIQSLQSEQQSQQIRQHQHEQQPLYHQLRSIQSIQVVDNRKRATILNTKLRQKLNKYKYCFSVGSSFHEKKHYPRNSIVLWNRNIKDKILQTRNSKYRKSSFVIQKLTAFIKTQPKTLSRKLSLLLSSTTKSVEHDDNKQQLLYKTNDNIIVDNSLINIDEKQVQSNRQSIAVIGSGAVGCYYGCRLYGNGLGHDVSFYMRGDNYNTAKTVGLTVTSDVGSDMYIPADKIKAYDKISDMGTYDWIIISIKSTYLASIPEMIVPLMKHDNTTRVLAIMNGMIENDLIYYIKNYTGQVTDGPLQCCQTLYGGMAFICSNRISPANVHHSCFGTLSIGVACTRTAAITSSTMLDNDQIEIEKLFYKHINKAFIEVDIVYEKYLQKGRWKKMIWNLPFNGLCVAYGGITVDMIVTNTTLRQIAFDIMDETIAAANTELQLLLQNKKLCHDENEQFVFLGDNEKYAMMKLSEDMGPYKPSTMLDFINRRSMEVQYLFIEPLQRAQNMNISTPQLHAIVARIQQLEKEYELY